MNTALDADGGIVDDESSRSNVVPSPFVNTMYEPDIDAVETYDASKYDEVRAYEAVPSSDPVIEPLTIVNEPVIACEPLNWFEPVVAKDPVSIVTLPLKYEAVNAYEAYDAVPSSDPVIEPLITVSEPVIV